ncbi:tRNA-modifying protein YgfZ [Buchnera aphidicola]|nr:tRNA-modifying protein YgfZ [Buchnera aphidicola (Stegophylla sp.)]
MNIFNICKSNNYHTSNVVLTKFLCSFAILYDWSLIWVSGLDSKKYLQSQITRNLFLLNYNKHILSAHCNARGKVWNILHLFHYNHGYAYIQQNDLSKIQINELKRYSIFSDVNIVQLSKFTLLGVFGLNCRKVLSDFFNILPDKNKTVVYVNDNVLLWFDNPIERFLLILKQKDFLDVKTFLLKQSIQCNLNKWLFLDIQSGFPMLNIKTTGKFIPQELNLENLKGIDFDKGCYCGQEVISRLHFRNINKRNLYCLIGITKNVPCLLEDIEMYDNSWKKVGNIFFVLQIKKNIFCIQGILKNIVSLKNIYRLSNDVTSYFIIK